MRARIRDEEAVKIHEVVKWPDPVLAKPGETVTVFDAKLKKLVEEMFETHVCGAGDWAGGAADRRSRSGLR